MNRRWKVLGFVVGAVLLGVVVKSAIDGRETELWRNDISFSSRLFGVSHDGVPADAGNAISMIDALQIYRLEPGAKSQYQVVEIVGSSDATLVFESQEKTSILRFLNAATNLDAEPKDCAKLHTSPVFYVVAYDRTLMRSGHFKFLICKKGSELHAKIYFPTQGGGASIGFNKTLIQVLKDLGYFEFW